MAIRNVVVTAAFSFVIGALMASLIAWLLVPERLSVDYLTPIVVAGPFIGLLVGGVVVWSLGGMAAANVLTMASEPLEGGPHPLRRPPHPLRRTDIHAPAHS